VKDIALGFPHFDGTSPILEWIFKAEKFFTFHNTPDAARVDIAAMHFDKEVVAWFQMLHRMNAVTTWAQLTHALETEFGPSLFDSPMAELFKLTQTGSVSDYYLKFMSLANRSFGLTDDHLLTYFMSGLHPDIQRDVMVQSPASLLRAVSLAKLYEEKYIVVSKHTAARPSSTSYGSRFTNVNPLPSQVSVQPTKTFSKPSLPPLLPTPSGPPLRNAQVKKISPAEMQLRREKGLCYFCDEKFSLTHRCRNRQYLYLNVEEEDTPLVELDTPTVTDNDTDVSLDDPYLSLNALKGGVGVGTIQFKACIGKLLVTVLIDGGSSDNFLQPRITRFLKLSIEPATQFKVMVGNGNYMTAEGLIQQLQVHAQGNFFCLPVFLFPISGADLILGASWLKTIGPHIADYAALQLKFLHNGHFTTLRGDADLVPTPNQLHHIRRLVHTNAIAEIFSMQVLEPSPSDSLHEMPADVEPELALLLHTYCLVFNTPSTLPPPRSHDHSIPLMDGAGPVKVKPYRYPHSQKTEIERLVDSMLQEGIIKPSQSPFFSPVILVKKDGSWRVCTYYRALNAITIKDSFPIPTVDELIDELYGPRYSSKLDLRSGYHQILLNPAD
jgi:hypothetical protein